MSADESVAQAAQAAYAASTGLSLAADRVIDDALRAMARHLRQAADPVLAANRADRDAAEAAGMGTGLLDRLRLDDARLDDIAGQLLALADVAFEAKRRRVRDLPNDLVLEMWRRPVGVIGANFEARPNVVVDVASQLIKSRNAGVLRTGSAALGSAIALADHVIAPALAGAGLPAGAIQLVRVPGRHAAEALVRFPGQMPLVI